MAYVFGDDGGTVVGGRRRPTNAGNPFDTAIPNGNTGVSGTGPGGSPTPQVFQDPANGGANNGSTTTPAPAPAPVKYAPIQGFDFDKLSGLKPYDSKEKYSDAVRAFSAGLGSGVHYGRNDLGGMLDYLHGHGFAGAKGVGDDKIDFGDGNGAIDTVMSNGSIWFQNGADRFASHDPFAQSAAPSTPQTTDPYANLPSWMTDGLTPQDLVRLSYNSYLGRDPGQGEIDSQFGSAHGVDANKHLIDIIDSIAKSAEASQYRQGHQDAAPAPQAPSLQMFQNPAAVGQALQLLSQKLPDLMNRPNVDPRSADPLTRWLMSLLGVS